MTDPLLTERGPGFLGRLLIVLALYPVALVCYRFRAVQCWRDGFAIACDPDVVW